MIRSMTAFVQSQAVIVGTAWVWELRSVNHRYLDVQFRLPDPIRQFEPLLSAKAQEVLARGRVEIMLNRSRSVASGSAGALDSDSVAALAALSEQVLSIIPNAKPLSVQEVLKFPGVLSGDHVDSDALEAGLLESLSQALVQLVQAREREGARILSMLEKRVAAIRAIVVDLLSRKSSLEAAFAERWKQRLAQLGGESLEPQRVHQEMAVLLTKSDVAEELDRLHAHCDELDDILSGDPKSGAAAVGRRLDFMAQELNREANTLGAKSYHPALTESSVELKVLIDQMREQIQNVE